MCSSGNESLYCYSVAQKAILFDSIDPSDALDKARKSPIKPQAIPKIQIGQRQVYLFQEEGMPFGLSDGLTLTVVSVLVKPQAISNFTECVDGCGIIDSRRSLAIFERDAGVFGTKIQSSFLSPVRPHLGR